MEEDALLKTVDVALSPFMGTDTDVESPTRVPVSHILTKTTLLTLLTGAKYEKAVLRTCKQTLIAAF